MEYKGLPVFEATITSDDCGITCISLVSDPATDINFVCFEKQERELKFSVENATEHIVSGVIMVADTPIYRRTSDGFEYYIIFSKQTLKEMAEKFLKDGSQGNVNIEHAGGTLIKNVNLLELFCIDREKGINPSYFSNVPDGSLIGIYKVRNNDVWALIEAGQVVSFSLEGVFDVYDEEFKKTNNVNKKNNKMSKIKNALRKLLEQFGSIETDNGILDYETEELEIGTSVTIEGNPAPDGEYVTEDKVIVVADGKVAEIKDKEAPVEEEVIEVEAEEEVPAEEVAEEVEEVVDEVAEAAEDVAEAAEEGRDFAAEIDALMARIAELEARIAELTGKDTEPTIEETFQKQTKGLSKAERMASFLKN